MPRRSLNHESQQEPSKWVCTSIHLLLWAMKGTTEVREKPFNTRTGQEHATRETKTTKINPIMWLLQGFFPQANMYSRCHVGNPCPSCAKSISALVMLCWCLVQHSSAFTRTSQSCSRCERVLSGRGWTLRFCWPFHCMVSKSPHNCLCSAWTCWCTWCIDPPPRLTTWEKFWNSGPSCSKAD